MADYLQSQLLLDHGFRHGFSLRTGGLSAPPFDSLNLARAVGDHPERVEANHRLLADAVGYPVDRLYEVSQVHGATVWQVGPDQQNDEVRRQKADALVAREPPAAVGVRVADCLPLLLADPETGAVAAIHAGWRGAVAGIVPAGFRALASAAGPLATRSPAERLLAAIFPHIRPCCFEVGTDVADQLASAYPQACGASLQENGDRGGNVIRATGKKPHINLAATVRAQLRDLGLADNRIDDIPGCTRCDPHRFFSYRRDGKASGRHLAVIAVRTQTFP